MSLFVPDRLLGRSAEESILLNSYFASLSMNQNSPASVILIHGESGLGKTKLAETLRSHVVEDDGYFIKGKFDQLSYGSANRPYQGIASAFAEYCAAVEQRSPDVWSEVAEKLQREIKGEEGRLLFEAIPSLRKIIGGDSSCRHGEAGVERRHSCDACQHIVVNDEEEKVQESLDNFSESGSHRLNYLIKRFVSVISSIGDPIVLLIDDIQWANKTDLDVLKAIFLGAQNPFMLIFTCRPMEPTHQFRRMSDEFAGKTEIQLEGLRRNNVRELVAEILRIDDPETCTSLTNFISRVTDGNPFFVRQQVASLCDEGLIRFGANGWHWDIEAIEEIHDTSGNVMTMLSEKMKRLPLITQHALTICSCIGSKVDLFLLGLLVREKTNEDCGFEDNETLATRAVSMASQEGLLVISRTGKAVTFTHDSVNEAAYCLLEPEQQASYHLTLGKILYKTVCPNLYQKYLFTIAAQLARGIKLVEDGDRIRIVQIFLSAGEKSLAASAFPEAHFFFSKGIDLLREDDWMKNYRLCCDIWMRAADTAGLTSDYRHMDKCLAMLFDHCKGSVVDFLNASQIKVRSLNSKDDPSALDVGIEALQLAGEKIPSKHLHMHTIVGLARIRCSMKWRGSGKLLQLPPVKDPEMIAILRLLKILVTISISYNQELLPLLCFRLVQLTLTHGASEVMPSSMALYGAILSRRGHSLAESEKYGEIALALLDKLGCNDSSHVTFLTYGSAFTQIKKLSDCIKPLQAGYDSGVKNGDLTHAMSCATRRRLSKVAALLGQLRISLSELGMIRALRGTRNYLNAVAHCIGDTRASRFTVPDPDDSNGCKKATLPKEQGKFLQMVVACIFCDYELAWATSEELHGFSSHFGGTIWPYICAFYRGMSAISMLPISRSRGVIGTIKKCLKQLRKGRKKCKINLSHHSYLLEAEYCVLKKKYTSAEKFYLLAIEHVTLAGVIHEHAYICERFGGFHLLLKNHDEAYKQIREAHKLYFKWGSRPKCELLKKKYPKLDEKKEELFEPISI